MNAALFQAIRARVSKAKSVIWLFREGAPSAVDMFDPKPELTKRDGKRIEIDVFNSGIPRPGFPSAGSWVTYGLGSENNNLPGYNGRRYRLTDVAGEVLQKILA